MNTERQAFPHRTLGDAYGESDTSPRLVRATILGTEVTVCSFKEAKGYIAWLVDRRIGAYVSCANAYSVSLALEDGKYRSILNGANFVTADGMSVVRALRMLGYRAERVHNDDLFLACCAEHLKWRHFLVGGRDGQPEAVAAEMGRRFPGIEVVGAQATPVRPVPADDNDAILEQIRQCGPSIVWVGMGTPAQDYWMVSASKIGVPMVGVGSLFDVLSGQTRPAPEWMKRSGLQWAFRLGQEPRRLATRYVYHNTRFLLGFARQFARHMWRS